MGKDTEEGASRDVDGVAKDPENEGFGCGGGKAGEHGNVRAPGLP